MNNIVWFDIESCKTRLPYRMTNYYCDLLCVITCLFTYTKAHVYIIPRANRRSTTRSCPNTLKVLIESSNCFRISTSNTALCSSETNCVACFRKLSCGGRKRLQLLTLCSANFAEYHLHLLALSSKNYQAERLAHNMILTSRDPVLKTFSGSSLGRERVDKCTNAPCPISYWNRACRSRSFTSTCLCSMNHDKIWQESQFPFTLVTTCHNFSQLVPTCLPCCRLPKYPMAWQQWNLKSTWVYLGLPPHFFSSPWHPKKSFCWATGTPVAASIRVLKLLLSSRSPTSNQKQQERHCCRGAEVQLILSWVFCFQQKRGAFFFWSFVLPSLLPCRIYFQHVPGNTCLITLMQVHHSKAFTLWMLRLQAV